MIKKKHIKKGFFSIILLNPMEVKMLKTIFAVLLFFICEAKNYQHYNHNPNLIRDKYGYGCYLDPCFTGKIDHSKIDVIVEIGSRDCIDAINLANFYQTNVISFECNPEAIAICKKNILGNPNIELVEKAVWNSSGTIPFYPTTNENLGASACFKFTNGPGRDVHPGINQTEITVTAIRMDEWLDERKMEKIDLLCMDTQGATLRILQSFGEKIRNVKYILTEGCIQLLYDGEDLIPEIISYLESKGFSLSAKSENYYFGDYLFVNNN